MTMKLYELFPGPLLNYEINAAHLVGLPGLKCARCGETWAAVGVSYPLVDAERLGRLLPELKSPAPIPGSRFVKLREAVEREVGTGRYLPPGTDFGPLIGTASGAVHAALWVNPWTLLLRRDAYERAFDGLQPPKGAVAVLSGASAEFLEIEATPRRLLGVPETCSACGRFGVRRDGSKKILFKRWPVDDQLSRVEELPSVLLATETLARKLASLAPGVIAIAPCEAL